MFELPPRPKSDYELQRDRNALLTREFWKDDEDAEFNLNDAVNALQEYSESMRIPKRVAKRKRTTRDASFSFSGQIPAERRCSLRLARKDPEFSYKELPEDEGSIRRFSDLDERNRSAKRVRRAPLQRISLLSFDGPLRSRQFTQADFDNIAKSSSGKIYSPLDGSTCHQCRQKTLDTKTYCRNPDCIGTRGLFCGPCLKNRYGEEVMETLLNLTWLCPVCRGICNCSFCRARQGKNPTGIKAPQAFSEGFKSVKDLLNYEEGEPEEALEYLELANTEYNSNDVKVVIIKIPQQRIIGNDLSVLIFENLARQFSEVDIVRYGIHEFRIELERANDTELKQETINEKLTEISKDISKRFLEENKGKQLVVCLDSFDAMLQENNTSSTKKEEAVKSDNGKVPEVLKELLEQRQDLCIVLERYDKKQEKLPNIPNVQSQSTLTKVYQRLRYQEIDSANEVCDNKRWNRRKRRALDSKNEAKKPKEDQTSNESLAGFTVSGKYVFV